MINCVSFKIIFFVTNIFQIVIIQNGISKVNSSKFDFLSHFGIVTKRSVVDKKCITNIGIGAIAPDFQNVSKRYYGMSPGFSVAGGLGFLGSGRGHQKSGHRECNHSNECESHDDHGFGYPEKTHGNYAGGGVSFSDHSEPNCLMMHNSQNGHQFHGGALHMDAGGHLSRAHHGIHGHGIGGGGGHGGHPDHQCHESHDCHERDHSCEGFGGGHHQMMQVPLSPLPQGYHEGFGPSEHECENHECENHNDDDCEEEERERQYAMDRGGCDEGHWLRQEKQKASGMENDPPVSQTASHSLKTKEFEEETKDIDGSVVSGIIKPSKGTDTGTDVENEGFFPTKLCDSNHVSGETGVVSAGLKDHKKKYGELQWDQDMNGKDKTELHHEHLVGHESRNCNHEQKKSLNSKPLSKGDESKREKEGDTSKLLQIDFKNLTKSETENAKSTPSAIKENELGDMIEVGEDKVHKQEAEYLSSPQIIQLEKNSISVNSQIKDLQDLVDNVNQPNLSQEPLTMHVSIVSPQRSVLPINSSLVEDEKHTNRRIASNLKNSSKKLLSNRDNSSASDEDKFDYSHKYSTKSSNFESKSEFKYNQSKYNFTLKYNSKHPGYKYEYNFGAPSTINPTDENKLLNVNNNLKDEKVKDSTDEKVKIGKDKKVTNDKDEKVKDAKAAKLIDDNDEKVKVGKDAKVKNSKNEKLIDDKDEKVKDAKDEKLIDDKDEKVKVGKDAKVKNSKNEKLIDDKDEKVKDAKDEKLIDNKDEKVKVGKDVKVKDAKDAKLIDDKDEKVKDGKEETDLMTSLLIKDVVNKTQGSTEKKKKRYRNSKDFLFQSVNHTSKEASNNFSVTAPFLESVLLLENPYPQNTGKIPDIKELSLVVKTSSKESKNKLSNLVFPKQTKNYSKSVKLIENNQKVNLETDGELKIDRAQQTNKQIDRAQQTNKDNKSMVEAKQTERKNEKLLEAKETENNIRIVSAKSIEFNTKNEEKKQNDDKIADVKQTPNNNITADVKQTPNNNKTTDVKQTKNNDKIADVKQTQNNDKIADVKQTQNNDKIADVKQTQNNDKIADVKQTQNNDKIADVKQTQNNDKITDVKQTKKNNKIGIENKRAKKLNSDKHTKSIAYINSKKTKNNKKVTNIKENVEEKLPSIEDNTPQDHPSKIQDALTESNNNINHDIEKPFPSKLASLISFTVKKKKPYGSILKEDNAAYQPLTVHSKNLDLIISPIRCDNCERRLVEDNHTKNMRQTKQE